MTNPIPMASSWSELPADLLNVILTKLPVPFLAVRLLVRVCSSWRASFKGTKPGFSPILIARPPIFDFQNLHLLTLYQDFKNPLIRTFPQKRNIQKWIDNGFWVGFSHGWMVVLDNSIDPFLLHPFTGHEIKLPRREFFPDIHEMLLKHGWELDDPQKLMKIQCSMIIKAILSANPSFQQDYKVVIIHGSESKLAVYTNGDQGWCVFGNSPPYHDVVCYDNKIYALCDEYKIEVWTMDNYSAGPIRIINPVGEENIIFSGPKESQPWGLRSKIYVVPSTQEIFYIKRYIASNTSVYRTVSFKVYKMDLTGWRDVVEINSLGNNVLFLGGNENKMIPASEYEGAKGNCIYFLDDSRKRWIDELHPYQGYDVGIYRLENSRLELIRDCVYEPMPYWILPRKLNAKEEVREKVTPRDARPSLQKNQE